MMDALPPLWLSLQTAAAATLLATAVAVPLAYGMARRRFAGKAIVEGMILMPIVLPPTVVGYLLIVALGGRGWLAMATGYSIVFRIEGAILAAAIVALPLLYLPARAGFASVDRELEDVATLMGATRWQTFWHVSVPLAARGLASGAVLGFARALGEFGATMMVFGYQPGRLTLPISIWADYEQGDLAHAWPAVAALSGLALALTLAYNATRAGRQG